MSDALDPGLPLADLREPVRLRSRLLDDDLWIIPDGWSAPVAGVTYTVSECRQLLRLELSAVGLRALHAVKKGFDGTLAPLTEDDS